MSEAKTLNNKTTTTGSYLVTGMSCAACAASVESILNHSKGVESATVNFASETVQIEYNKSTSPQELKAIVQKAGYDLTLDTENQPEKKEEIQLKQFVELKKKTIGAAIFTLPIVVLGMFFMNWEPGKWISMILAIPVITYFGRNFYTEAWKQAKNHRANMDTLVALSTGIAFIFSLFNLSYPELWHSKGIHAHVYFEAATVIITFILLGKLLESRAKSQTSSAIKKLMGLQPKTVTVLVDDNEIETPIQDIKKNNIILVKPGEKIPVDGTVTTGSTYINESMISGEPIPVLKEKGDKVYAGTINQKGSIQFAAEKVGQDTYLAQLIKLVQQAQGSKAQSQKLADKIAGIFVPIVLGIAVITFATWLLIGGENSFTHALLTSITVLVIACPCALGLATPTAIMTGIGKGASNNILIKDAESLELAHKVNAIILDKTGTITKGKPTVTDVYWLPNTNTDNYASILLALESQSEHPLAEAVVSHLQNQLTNKVPVTNFQSITGKGAQALYENTKYLVGNQKLIQENKISINIELLNISQKWQNEGKTVIYFTNDQFVLALIAISDQIKPSSKLAIAELQQNDIEVYMLTGDSNLTAKTVAEQIGIRKYQSELSPMEKAAFIQKLQKQGKTIAMVGDGINDAQALAQADVSIAMGQGTDIAMDIAQITLTSSDLLSIPKALLLSQKTVKTIRQNLFWAFIYNLIGIPIAAGILYPFYGFLLNPMLAGAAMALSSLSVITNSLRLNKLNLSINSPIKQSNMSEYTFKTTINCESCLANVSPTLNQESNIDKWEVNLQHKDRLLMVQTTKLTAEEVKQIVQKTGFKAELIN